MAGGFITKGITLSYKKAGESDYTVLPDLQEIPDMGGSADSIETTTFDDAAHTYISGLIDMGDSFDFVFLHKPENFAIMKGLCEESIISWKVSFPDGENGAILTTCSWDGDCSLKINGTGVNEAITDTLSVKPSTEITWG